MSASLVTIIILLIVLASIQAIQMHIDFKRAHAEMLARINTP